MAKFAREWEWRSPRGCRRGRLGTFLRASVIVGFDFDERGPGMGMLEAWAAGPCNI